MVGSIIFIIFMDDIVNGAPNVNTVLLAVDKNIFLTGSDPVRIVHRANTTLSNL